VNILSIDFDILFERVSEYKRLGLNPLALATGCAVKVDLVRVVYPALRDLREELEREGLEIAPREDADIIKGSSAEIFRRIYSLDPSENIDSRDVANIDPDTATVVIQIYQRYADKPEMFAKLIEPVYRGVAKASSYIKRKIRLGKGHSIVTPFQEDQFALFDFIKTERKDSDVYTAVNNDTIHIIDPTEPPGDPRQVYGALSNSLNDLFVLGVYKNIKIAPVINAPDQDVLEKLYQNMRDFANRYGFKIIDVPRPSRGRLLLGATVVGEIDRRPPMFDDHVKDDMMIIVTRSFGELAPLNIYLASIIDQSIINDLEREGIDLSDLIKAKDHAYTTISTPNISAAKTIYKYLPEINEDPDPENHIMTTTDVTGPGIYVFVELAEKTKSIIELENIPLMFPKFSEFATKYFIMPNATAGTNGAFVIISHRNIAESLIKDLRREGLEPKIIGRILRTKVSEPRLRAPRDIIRYVADKKILSYIEIY
jgi:selenophosphate synthase